MMSDFPFLSVLTVAPLVGAAGGGLPAAHPAGAGQAGGASAGRCWCWCSSVVMWIAFEAGGDRFQFRESYPWIPAWGVSFTFAADGIALVMLVLIAVLVPLVILASWHDAEPSQAVGAGLLRAAAGPRVHDDRRLRRRRRLPVLRVLRGHARADVLPHRLATAATSGSTRR